MTSKPPDGWDELGNEMANMGKSLREMYLGMISAGFTSDEALKFAAYLFAAISIPPSKSAGD